MENQQESNYRSLATRTYTGGVWFVGVLVLAVLLAVATPLLAIAGGQLALETLSNRLDKLSGGDALVYVDVPPGVALDEVTLRLDGVDVTDLFAADGSGGLIGLIEGMAIGKNLLQAKAKGAGTATLQLVNHPLEGPVFSGPHEQPFFCQTQSFEVYPGGETLGPALDENCSVPRRVDYVYRSTGGQFKGLDLTGDLPDDLASTTTTEGVDVPYIVRVETGVINRAIYQTAILDDLDVPGPNLQGSDGAWNGRVVYNFGGGCRAGWYAQGDSTGAVLDDRQLSQGFATASASLNVFGNNCNDLLTAETMMMVKERFIETYGVPRYTIGWGCSGGSYQTHQIGDNYPGLLDGIVPQCSFPDVGFGTVHTLADARLLEHYYDSTNVPGGVAWTEEELRAVSGFGVFDSIPNLSNGAARIDPVPNRPDGRTSAEFDPVVPVDVRYDPVTNPDGARATVYDHTINAYGMDRKTGFARRPLDNVGIQYGLEALNAGEISVEQFLDINEKIGGFDIDANFVPERMVADRKATRAAYATGRMLNGGGGLAEMPILDYDYLNTDLQDGGDIHMKFQHFSTRERLRKANGHIDNHVMWSGGADFAQLFFFGAPWVGAIFDEALRQMDQWLANIEADTSDDPRAIKVVHNKPFDLGDGCWSQTADPAFFPETQTFGGPGTSFCNDTYPAFPFPRMVAGGPLANDIIKCRLKDPDPSDYAVPFSPEQWDWLQSIFPDGMCDWSKPGIEQRGLLGTWITFTDIGKYKKDTPPPKPRK
jgi:hypothetical protein